MEKTKRITFRMSEEEFAAINDYAATNAVNISKALRRCVADAFLRQSKDGSAISHLPFDAT